METSHLLPNIATRRMMDTVIGFWVSALFATPVRDAMGSTLKSPAPISPTFRYRSRSLFQLGRGGGPKLHEQQTVHSVSSTVCQSPCSVPVGGDVSVAFRSSVGQVPTPIVVSASSVSPLCPTIASFKISVPVV